jgi:hypothetical protein
MGVRLDDWIYWPLYRQLVTTSNVTLSLIYTLYSSLLHAVVASVCYTLHWPFPDNGFNTGTITFSLNHTLQISLYYSTYIVFSSHPDFQIHWTTLSNFNASIPQFNSSAPKLISWQAGVSKLNWFSVAISSQLSSTVTSQLTAHVELRNSTDFSQLDSSL